MATEAVVTDACADPPLITTGQKGHVTEEIDPANRFEVNDSPDS